MGNPLLNLEFHAYVHTTRTLQPNLYSSAPSINFLRLGFSRSGGLWRRPPYANANLEGRSAALFLLHDLSLK